MSLFYDNVMNSNLFVRTLLGPPLNSKQKNYVLKMYSTTDTTQD
jgi:hypothetical protein